MRVQLWSYNYDPEPTGIAPVSRTWAQAMRERGHEVHVVAAHPHYPEPKWGSRRRPYVEDRDGVKVTRLPLWIGRETANERMRQEASFAAWQTAYLPRLGGADAVVAVSPCFPALAPAILNRKLRRKPLIAWIQDILPDGAVSTGLMDEGAAIRASRKLELKAYRTADRIVVISDRFRDNLLAKGVPETKIERIYNPATRPVATAPRSFGAGPPGALVMGNIGHSQGLPEVARLFQDAASLAEIGARLTITGTGVEEAEVRAAIDGDRVRPAGVVSDRRLDEELALADVGLVTQRAGVEEFNLPSKLMNYLAVGLPVLALVPPESEVASIVRASGAGVVVDSNEPSGFGDALAALLRDRARLAEASESGRRFAVEQLTAGRLAERFERLLAASGATPGTG